MDQRNVMLNFEDTQGLNTHDAKHIDKVSYLFKAKIAATWKVLTILSNY